ncbi:MAG: hypothetical protein HS117_06390 [Verrucomicrobiaceae bacterium]|jgi:hypothetical protein|nr:hypothetical protein [Verrucomicrobiaceae bacterium]
MNASQPVSRDPRELRPLLHQKLDAISDAAIGAVHDLLVEFERRWLFAQMTEEAETDRLAGKHDPAMVEQAVRAHRARHPYSA